MFYNYYSNYFQCQIIKEAKINRENLKQPQNGQEKNTINSADRFAPNQPSPKGNPLKNLKKAERYQAFMEKQAKRNDLSNNKNQNKIPNSNFKAKKEWTPTREVNNRRNERKDRTNSSRIKKDESYTNQKEEGRPVTNWPHELYNALENKTEEEVSLYL